MGVELAARAGYDPADPITERSVGKVPDNYTQFLDKNGLQGARIGVFRHYLDAESGDPEIKALMEQAIVDLQNQGAIIIDPFVIENFDSLTNNIWCNVFQHDVNNYLASLGDKAPHKTLDEIVATGKYAPYIESRLQRALAVSESPEQRDPPCLDLYSSPRNIAFRNAVLYAMDRDRVDAIVYPTWSNPPRKIGDMESPAGDNSQLLSPHTGFPAITVPIGFTNNTLPAGMTFIGRLFTEPDLIKFAYAYEHASQHRHPPQGFE